MAASIPPPASPLARRDGFETYALSFDYGQRHITELEAARRIAAALQATAHRIAKIDLRVFGPLRPPRTTSPSPKDRDEASMGEGIPITYVPARNTIFSPSRSPGAEVLEASDIFIGVNALDYSGYPDCRPEFIEAFEKMSNLATKTGVEGITRMHNPHAADSAFKSRYRAARRGTRRSLRPHPQLLRSRCHRSSVQFLRFLSAPRKGFREAGIVDDANL